MEIRNPKERKMAINVHLKVSFCIGMTKSITINITILLYINFCDKTKWQKEVEDIYKSQNLASTAQLCWANRLLF